MAMTRQQYDYWMKRIMDLIVTDACHRFDAISPVRRVVIKVNPATQGEFVFMAILTNGQWFEGRTLPPTERRFDWCLTPSCNCKGFVALKSPLEVGITIDD